AKERTRSLRLVRRPSDGRVLGTDDRRGTHDPIAPISLTARSLPSHLVRFERLANCGHAIHGDDPDTVLSLIREFIADLLSVSSLQMGRSRRPFSVNEKLRGSGCQARPALVTYALASRRRASWIS